MEEQKYPVGGWSESEIQKVGDESIKVAWISKAREKIFKGDIIDIYKILTGKI